MATPGGLELAACGLSNLTVILLKYTPAQGLTHYVECVRRLCGRIADGMLARFGSNSGGSAF